MTRREFGLGAAASSVRAAPGSKIGAAIFGTGHAHAAGKAAALGKLPQFELAGFCEPRPEHCRNPAAFQGLRRLSERELLEDPSIELVAVEARVQENLEYAEKCVAAGKHVHIDKPPGEDFRRFRRLLAAAAQRGLMVQMGYMWRYHPAMRAALRAAREGWLGHVYALRATIDKPLSARERAELAAFRGGMMFELGCHMIDRALELFGKPSKVTGVLRHDGPFGDSLADNTLAVLEFSRAMAEIYVAAHQPSGNRNRTLEVLGTNGSIAVRPFNPARLHTDLEKAAGPYAAGTASVAIPAGPLPTYGDDFLEMARVIREGGQPAYTAGHDLAVQAALLEACGFSKKEIGI